MRTESDLFAAIDRLADGAPSAAELLARIELATAHHGPQTRGSSRRGHLLPAAAAAAVVLVALGVAGIGYSGDNDHGSSQSAARGGAGPSVSHPCATGPRLDLAGITMRHVNGIANGASQQVSCSGVTQRVLQTDDAAPAGTVEVFRAGVFDTSKLAGSTPISSAGVSGFLLPHGSTAMLDVADPATDGGSTCVITESPLQKRALRKYLLGLTPGHPATTTRNGHTVQPDLGDTTPATTCPAEPVLAWRYAPDSWALVSSPAQAVPATTKTQLLRLAAAVDTTNPTTAQAPFTADSLPAGIRITDIYMSESPLGTITSVVVGLGVTGRPGCAADTACEQFGEISATPTSAHTQKPNGTPVTINNRTGYLLDQGDQRPDVQLAFTAPPWRVLLGQGSDHEVPDNTLLTIARALRFAPNAADSTTWFNLNTAFGN